MYAATYVWKSLPYEPASPEQDYGNMVHKAFELRQSPDLRPLPKGLEVHEEFMQRLGRMQGKLWTERKVGLDRRLQPCEFFGDSVWWRGVIDFECVSVIKGDGEEALRATIVDYKTGKPHQKLKQLQNMALHAFAEGVAVVDAMFYWTQTRDTTRHVMTRDQIPSLWGLFTPTLKQYVQAYKEDIWQPRQNALCNGWCRVKDCEFWRPRR